MIKTLNSYLTPKFWVLPLYRELLNSARRIRPSPSSERARGCTGLVKVICKENKEQKGKRKYHAGTPHPNDRGGFTQWFGSCSLITTLYVWFPACWAPMVAERLFSWSPPPKGSSYSQHGRSDSGPPHKYSGAHPCTVIVRVLLAQWGKGGNGKSLTARKCSTRSDNGHCQVLQLCQCSMLPVESSGLNWMIRPSWTAMGCYRRVSFVMCFRRSVRLRGRVLGGKGLR